MARTYQSKSSGELLLFLVVFLFFLLFFLGSWFLGLWSRPLDLSLGTRLLYLALRWTLLLRWPFLLTGLLHLALWVTGLLHWPLRHIPLHARGRNIVLRRWTLWRWLRSRGLPTRPVIPHRRRIVLWRWLPARILPARPEIAIVPLWRQIVLRRWSLVR